MQMEIISDLRERKLQVRTEERKGGYGTELLNNTAVEGIVGPAELSVRGLFPFLPTYTVRKDL